jgi:AraC-like DNA-binding protein
MEHLQCSIFTDSQTHIEQRDDCTVYRVSNETGTGEITDYPVFAGIHLMYNNFHMSVCPCQGQSPVNCLELNHCSEGCIEVGYNNKLYYMTSGDFSCASKDCIEQYSFFPSAQYHGISVYIDFDLLTEQTVSLLRNFSIDIHLLHRMFFGSGTCLLLKNNGSVEHLFAELYTVHESVRTSYLKIKILELLLFLSVPENLADPAEKELYPAYRIEKVKEIRTFISDHLDSHLTVEDLAVRFALPLTALKLCFRAVYGMPVASFIRDLRMQRAAELLRTTDLSVIDIAGRVGYDNPSKFASAFRGIMHGNPAEYRHSAEYRQCNRW